MERNTSGFAVALYGTVKWRPRVEGRWNCCSEMFSLVYWWIVQSVQYTMDMSGNSYTYCIHMWKDLARWDLILMIFDSASILTRNVCMNRRESFLADLGSSTLGSARYFGLHDMAQTCCHHGTERISNVVPLWCGQLSWKILTIDTPWLTHGGQILGFFYEYKFWFR